MKFFVLWALILPTAIEAQSIDQALAAGKEAMGAGKLADARIDFERALREEPRNAEANLQMGLLLGLLGDPEEARNAFRAAIRAKPDWPEAHYNLALTMVADPKGTRDWPGAMAECRTALKLRGTYAEAHHLLGVGLAETGQGAPAIAEFRAALAANPNSPETHLDLGNALSNSGETTAAEHEYRKAIELRPGYAEAEFALGKLLIQEQEPGSQSEAIERFRLALRSNPDTAAAQYALAKALQETGHSAEAAVDFQQAAELTKRPEDGVQCTRLSNEGLDAAHRGDREGAIRLLREALDLRPDSAIAHFNLGLVLADHGETAAGISQAIEAISLAPAYARFYAVLGQMYLRSGDRQHARAAFERAMALDPGDQSAPQELLRLGNVEVIANDAYQFGAPSDTADAHFAFADVLGGRGDWLGAAGEWERVLTLQPANVDARNNLGVSYAHLGKDDRAELEFRKALQVSADSAGAHFGLAILALEHGNKRQAAQELRVVLRVKPDYPKAQSLLATVSQ